MKIIYNCSQGKKKLPMNASLLKIRGWNAKWCDANCRDKCMMSSQRIQMDFFLT